MAARLQAVVERLQKSFADALDPGLGLRVWDLARRIAQPFRGGPPSPFESRRLPPSWRRAAFSPVIWFTSPGRPKYEITANPGDHQGNDQPNFERAAGAADEPSSRPTRKRKSHARHAAPRDLNMEICRALILWHRDRLPKLTWCPAVLQSTTYSAGKNR